MAKPKTPAQQIREAQQANAFHAFCTNFRLHGGEGWWEAEVVLEGRKFRYDARHHDSMVLLEIQGGVWMEKGGHNTGQGIIRDIEKVNFAQYQGYAILQLTTEMVEGGEPDVYLPLVQFVNGRAEIFKAVTVPDVPHQSGRLGVF